MFGFDFPGGLFFFPLVFTILNSANDVFGYRKARQIVWFSSLALLIGGLLVWIAFLLPENPEIGFHNSELVMIRIRDALFTTAIASIIGSWLCIWVFSWLKSKTVGRHLWLRCFASTAVVHLVFATPVAFVLIHHGFAHVSFMEISLYTFGFRLLLSTLFIPMTYAFVWFARR
ncbi:queuosine precursor transporter [Dongshaea marina]|uniref:queuosine precursor transporter n=1 Tax=Dongshaea marina TaxID=2047966 RepID=UPI00131F23E3|nr:queuosine precursor transporter [Dongshaea marina]